MEKLEEKPIDDTSSTNKSTSPGKSSNRNLVGGAAFLLIIMLCCLVAAIGVMIDPFDWHLLSSLTGDSDAVVESMPADTGLYIGLDMERFTPAALARVIDPFLVEDTDIDYREFAEILNDLDDELESSAGFNLTSWLRVKTTKLLTTSLINSW